MTDWTSGYVTEVGYTYGYYPELAPLRLAFAALTQGFSAPGLGLCAIRVLELGCGQGFSANLIAAANPHVDYTATDFNPAHIAGAQALAREGAVQNVHFREASFEEIAQDDSLGEFDIISLHGVYTWVSAENREHIIKIAHDKLKAGGLLYVSYNCYPGWAHVVPIRRIFTESASAHPRAPIFERLNEGFRTFERLRDIKARCIVGSPGIVERMERSKTMQPNYLAHEYLNDDWTIFYFPEVAAEMGRAKLTYVGSANLLDNVDNVNFTPEQIAFLNEARDPVQQQWFRDLIVGQQFRRDVYLKGALPIGAVTGQEKWVNLRLALSSPAGDVPRRVAGSMGEVQFRPEIYEPILAKLNDGPTTVRDLMTDPAISALGWLGVGAVINILVGQGHCHPALPASGEGDRIKRTDALNQAILRRSREGANLGQLASPVLGAGVSADLIMQLYLLGGREKAQDRVQFVWSWLKQRGEKLVKEGKTLDTEEENLGEIRERISKFEAGQNRVFAQLKVG